MPTDTQSRRSLLRSTFAASVAAVVAKVMPSRARAAEAADVAPLPVVAKAPTVAVANSAVCRGGTFVQTGSRIVDGSAYDVEQWKMTIVGGEPCHGHIILRSYKEPPEVFNLRDFGPSLPDMRCKGKIVTVRREAIDVGGPCGYRQCVPSRDFTFTVDFVELR